MDTFKLFLLIIVVTAFLMASIMIFAKCLLYLKAIRFKSLNTMIGKTVIITGGNSGHGYATAIDLASRGARVILACRNEHRAMKARESIINKTKNQNVFYKIVDVSDMESVRRFCREILAYEARLDVLINNAGCLFQRRKESAQGYELTLATNHHGHFLMTILLIGLLRRSSPSRIINVSSKSHYRCHLDFDDLHFRKRKYGLIKANSQSKLCNILFTKELSRRLTRTGVTVNAMTPGSMATGIMDKEGTVTGKIMKWVSKLIFKSPKLGAQTTIHLAVADEVATISGAYFENCQISICSNEASNLEFARKLWEITEVEVNLREEEKIWN